MDHIESFEDSCLAAQRAAVESVEIGRNTLEQAQLQSEQLVRASTIADDTKYDLDHAARLLKNMTWTGWLSNKFAKEPMIAKNVTVKNDASRFNGAGGAGPTTATANRQTPSTMLDDNLTLIDNVPKSHQAAVQSLSNYRANLRVLQDFCENNINQPIDNEEEKQQLTTLQTICNAMYETARVQLEKLQSDCTAATTARDDETIRCALLAELRQLRERQVGLQSRQTQRTLAKPTSSQSLVLPENNGRVQEEQLQQQQLEQAATSVAVNARSSYTMNKSAATKPTLLALQLQEQMQGDHLQFLSSNLEELGQLAQHLNHAVVSSVRTMDHLEDQSESILEQTKHVTRRADRMARHSNRSWFSSRSAGSRHLLGQVAICHVESGYYMRMWNGTVFLVPDFDKASCLLGIYGTQQSTKQTGAGSYGLVGIKNLVECTWLGQSLLGSLDAKATTFGHRQEWELDETFLIESNVIDGSSADRQRNIHGAVAATPSPRRLTRLLCASAGWGSGAYLMVGSAPHYAVTIGGSGVDEKNKAAMWCFVNQPP